MVNGNPGSAKSTAITSLCDDVFFSSCIAVCNALYRDEIFYLNVNSFMFQVS